MKKLIFTLSLLIVTIFSVSAQITITVSGTVTSSNTGLPVANQAVNIIIVDSGGTSGFTFQSTALTNTSGQYTFVVPGYPVYALINLSTMDCQNQMQYSSVYAPPYSANFSICTSVINPPCQSGFASIQDSMNTSTFHFLNTSTGNPSTFSWNFGDGGTSNLQNPSHTYNSTGFFMVSLTIGGSNCQSTSYDTIIVGGGVPCQANFASMQDTNNAMKYYFFNTSTGNPSSYSWSFGDGTSSNLANPTHVYAQNGTYTVTLIIFGSSCQSSVTQTIVVNGTQTYFLSGQIMAGNYPLDYGTVLLFDITNPSIASAIVDSMGYYYFGNLPASDYYIFAVPDAASMYFNSHAPTYYTNSMAWSTATTVSLNASSFNKNISLISINPTSGGGSINGTLNTNSKGFVSNAVVNLYNSSNAIVKTTKSNANGQYSFTNIAFGTYKIWVEIPGKTPAFIQVNLTEGQPSSSSNNFIVGSTSITVAPVSIDENSPNFVSAVYPNPVNLDFTIEYVLTAKSNVSIEIYNAFGMLVKTETSMNEAGIQKQNINTQDLANGTYFVKVSTSTGNHFSKVLIKM